MNTPQPARRTSSVFGRYLFVLILGLVIGMVATVMLVNTWNARKTTQDLFPDALMQVQQWHLSKLQSNVADGRCDVTDTLPHLESLRATARYTEQAFPDLMDDDRFKQASSGMRTVLNAAHGAPPLNCAGVTAMNAKIDAACKACHRDFRN